MHLALLALSLTLTAADAPKAEPLWPKAAPGALGDKDADIPTLTPFLPPADKATGAAVVICPGGGYGGLAISYEGMDVGAWMAKRGVAGFVLKYRVAPYKHPVPLEDAQRACAPSAPRQGVERRSQARRYHGLFGRRTSGLDGRHPL